jgi:HIV-1 Vpr-binding protein
VDVEWKPESVVVSFQIFILRFLTPLGEYQEFITYIFEQKILELLMGFVNMRRTNNARSLKLQSGHL